MIYLGDHTKANCPMAFALGNLHSMSDWILWNEFFAELQGREKIPRLNSKLKHTAS